MQNPIKHWGLNDVMVTFQLDFVQAKEIEEEVHFFHRNALANHTTPYVVCATVEDFPNWKTAKRTQLTGHQLERISTIAAKKGFVAHVLPIRHLPV